MLAVNYTELRGNMKECMDKVTDDYETLIVTRKKNKNIVMLSEETYNNMMENMHLMGNQTNYKWLMESKKQLEDGLFQIKTLSRLIFSDYKLFHFLLLQAEGQNGMTDKLIS